MIIFPVKKRKGSGLLGKVNRFLSLGFFNVSTLVSRNVHKEGNSCRLKNKVYRADLSWY